MGFAPINSGRCPIYRRFGESKTISFSRKFLGGFTRPLLAVAPGSSGVWIEIPREGKTDPKLDAKTTEEIVVHDLRKLPVNAEEGAKPNQCIVAYKQGRLYERRYFDENGRAIKDIDYTDHGNPKYHKVPHVHGWVYNKEKGRSLRQHDRDPRKWELS